MLRGDLFAGGLTRVFHAPAPTLTPYQRIPPSLKTRRDEFGLAGRAASLTRSSRRSSSPRARSSRDCPRRRILRSSAWSSSRGRRSRCRRFVARLTAVGYRRSDLVVETGDLAVRGGLFDVFAPDRELPVRIELDGDRIASIRVFDPDTQRSKERLVVRRASAVRNLAGVGRGAVAPDGTARTFSFGGRARRVRTGRFADAGRAGSTTPPAPWSW